MWPFKKNKNPEPETAEHARAKSMAEFFLEVQAEIDGQIASDPDWFHNLPYQGGMSKEEARYFEIEKRAMWRRVIFDAKRGNIDGLRWSTRGDDLVCPHCQAMDGTLFKKRELDRLEAVSVHLGCRCELLPVRS